MTKLKQFFPMLQERDHVKKIIKDNQKLYDLFSSWSMAQQSTFLNYVTGARGIKMLYDSFFKEVMNLMSSSIPWPSVPPQWPRD